MGKLNAFPPELLLRDDDYFMSTDFSEGLDTLKFAKGTNTAIATGVIHNPVNLAIPATNNAEEYVASVGKPLLFASGKPIIFRAVTEFTEAGTTGQVGQFIGMSSGTVTDLLTDDGAGVLASQSAAGFYVLDGGTVMSVLVQNGNAATRQTAELTANAQYNLLGAAVPASATGKRLWEIEIRDNGHASGMAKNLLVIFKVNGVVVYQMFLDPTSAALMAWVVQGKAGSAQAQTYYVHGVGVAQRKAPLLG